MPEIFAVDSVLRSKRLECYGHVCQIACKKVSYGTVKGRGVVGLPRKIWNDVLLSDTHSLNIRRPHCDAKICVEGKDCQRTHLAYAGKRIFIIVFQVSGKY